MALLIYRESIEDSDHRDADPNETEGAAQEAEKAGTEA